MNLLDRGRKILWTKAGNRCSYHYDGEICDAELVIDDPGKVSKDTVVGIECHIVAARPKGARYVEEFPERERYSNAILLCGKHHKVVDDSRDIYTADVLREMKKSHEKYIADKVKSGEVVIDDYYLVIEDYDLHIEAENADEIFGMKITKPTQMRDVITKIKAKNVKNITGVSTDQGMTSKIMICSHCGKPYPDVFFGSPPPKATCPHCGKENAVT